MISIHQHKLMEALRNLDDAVTALHAKLDKYKGLQAKLDDLINSKKQQQQAIDSILLELNQLIAVLENVLRKEYDE